MSDSNSFDPGNEPDRILAAIVESSDDAIFAKTLSGTILSWNRGAQRMYGYTPDEVLGRSIDMLVPADRRVELAGILERVGGGEHVEHFETVRKTKDGRLVDVSLTISPIRDAAGSIIGASAIGRDVTARKRDLVDLGDSEARLRSIVESAVDGIIVIDARGRVERFNAAAERLFGYAASEVIGRNVNVLMPVPYATEHDGYLARYLSTGEKRIIGLGREVTGRRKDGTTFPVHLSVGEMLLGGERKFTGILHDLTARMKVEEQLREQAALVRLGEMAAVIAHEVKNPLAAVRGAIQVIGKRLPADGREAGVVVEIIARIDGLNQLVKDLLLFARPPQPRPVAIGVRSVLDSTAALLGEDSAYRDLRIEVSGDAPDVMADPELLKIIFSNLLINSAQAMRGKGIVAVAVGSAGNGCRITVTDLGPGIPLEIRDKLFSPFVTTKSRGTGLGLSTVKRLVEAHHGRVAVESPSDGGTVVTVWLPLARPDLSSTPDMWSGC
jgi:two-component system sensor kinase FixL